MPSSATADRVLPVEGERHVADPAVLVPGVLEQGHTVGRDRLVGGDDQVLAGRVVEGAHLPAGGLVAVHGLRGVVTRGVGDVVAVGRCSSGGASLQLHDGAVVVTGVGEHVQPVVREVRLERLLAGAVGVAVVVADRAPPGALLAVGVGDDERGVGSASSASSPSASSAKVAGVEHRPIRGEATDGGECDEARRVARHDLECHARHRAQDRRESSTSKSMTGDGSGSSTGVASSTSSSSRRGPSGRLGTASDRSPPGRPARWPRSAGPGCGGRGARSALVLGVGPEHDLTDPHEPGQRCERGPGSGRPAWNGASTWESISAEAGEP